MSNIGVKRPKEVALMTAIESQIDEIAAGQMTPIEVIGVLEIVKMRMFDESLSTFSQSVYSD